MPRDTFETLLSLIKNYGFKPRFYIDRLHLYVDARVSETELLKLEKRRQANILIQPCTLEGHIYVNRKIELYQLGKGSLQSLKRLCESDGDYKITYLELAMDFYSESQSDIDLLRQFFNKHLVQLKKSQRSKKLPYFCDVKETYYYNKEKDSIRLAVYSDKPYRWKPSLFCVHIEYRYSGLKALKSLGILTAKDIVDFDHIAYWKQHLDLRRPNIKAIGEHRAKMKMSDNALNKKGNKFFDESPCLQKLLKDDPQLILFFPSMATGQAIEKYLERAFR